MNVNFFINLKYNYIEKVKYQFFFLYISYVESIP